MFQVRGLPNQITTSDLDELFKKYGEVQTWGPFSEDQNVVFVQLDKNEELAVPELDKILWRDQYPLLLDFVRGNGIKCGQPGAKCIKVG